MALFRSWFFLGIAVLYRAQHGNCNEIVPKIRHGLSFDRLLKILLPGEVSEECRRETDSIANYPRVVEVNSYIENWEVNLSMASLCVEQSNTKTTCALDYEKSNHTLVDTCLGSGAVFSSATYTFICTGGDLRRGQQLFYNGFNVPQCTAFSCTTDMIQTMTEEAVDDIMQELMAGGYKCERARLSVADPLIPEVGPEKCANDTSFIWNNSISDALAQRNELVALWQDMCLVSDISRECVLDFSTIQELMKSACQTEGKYVEMDYTLSCSSGSTGANSTGTNGTEANIFLNPPTMTLVGIRDPLCASTICQTNEIPDVVAKQMDSILQMLALDGWSCEVDELIFDDFATSASPTTSPAPSLSPAPSSAPSSSPAPTQTMAPSISTTSTQLSCSEWSLRLNYTESIWNETNRIQRRVIESCSESPTNDCIYDYSNIDNSIQALCQEEGGLFITDTVSISCESNIDEGGIAQSVSKWSYVNRPACRANDCNSKEFKQIAESDLTWMLSYLENDGTADDRKCSFQNVSFAIGGILAEDEGAVELSAECADQSQRLDTTIALYNQKQVTRKDFLAYVQRDLRDICVQYSGLDLRCNIDFAEEGFANNVASICPESGGQYVESTFRIACTKPDEGNKALDMTMENVPSCLGKFCSPGQSKLYLVPEHDWVAQHYESLGWVCETVVLDVFARYYDPSDTGVGDIQSPDTDSTGGVDDPVVAPPTEAPTMTTGDDPIEDPTTEAPGIGEGFDLETEAPLDAKDDDTGETVSEKNGLPGGATAGVVIVILSLVVGAAVYFFWIRRRRSRGEHGEDSYSKRTREESTDPHLSDEELGGGGAYHQGDFDFQSDEYDSEEENTELDSEVTGNIDRGYSFQDSSAGDGEAASFAGDDDQEDSASEQVASDDDDEEEGESEASSENGDDDSEEESEDASDSEEDSNGDSESDEDDSSHESSVKPTSSENFQDEWESSEDDDDLSYVS